MRTRSAATGLSLLLTCGCITPTPLGPTSQSEPDAKAPPAGQLGGKVSPLRYRLRLTLLPAQETFEGITEIDVRFHEATRSFYMHGLDLAVRRVVVTANERTVDATYAQVDPTGVARVTLNTPVPKGTATLRFEYAAPFNRKLQGIYRVDDAGEAYAFSQFEAISARLAFPSFDEPRFKTPFDISVSARADHVVITTTPEIGRTDGPDGLVTRRFATTKPLPTYLLAFAVGPLDVVEWEAIPPTVLRAQPIPLRGVAAKGKGDRLAYALKDTAELVTTLETYFGVAYPYRKLDLIAAPDYAFGAMENVGAIVYREERLLLDESSPIAQRRAYLMTHSHELAHQWFGNLVTPSWWTDIWLNESFASWMGNRAVSTARPKEDYGRVTLNRAIDTMRKDALASARQIREPVKRNLEIWSAFDGITYRKGGGILAMFEQYLGNEAFQAGVHKHMVRFADSVADANDFMESLALGSQRPEVIPAFRSFIEQPGVPMIEVEASCGEAPSLVLKQSRYAPLGSAIKPEATWGVPFCYATFDKAGQRKKNCVLFDKATKRIPLTECPDAVLPNAGGAGYYHFSLPSDDLAALLERFETLSPTEQLATFSSLEAAFRAGKASVNDLVAGAQLAVASEAWDVQLAPVKTLAELVLLLDESPEFTESRVNALYRPLLNRIGVVGKKGEPDSAQLTRPMLVRLLALRTADKSTRQALLPIAERHLEGKSTVAEKPLAGVALQVAAAEQGAPFVDRVINKLNTERDGFARGELVAAVARAPASQRKRIFELILSDLLRVNETIRLVGELFVAPNHKRAALAWMIENFDALKARLPSQFQGRILSVTSSLCDADSLSQLSTFDEMAGQLQGAKRALAQAKESISLCVALKAHVRPAVATQ